MQADALRAVRVRRRVLALPRRRRARRGAAGTRRSATGSKHGQRSLHLARALPHVAAQRDRALRAHRAGSTRRTACASSSTSSSSGATPASSSTTRRTTSRAATSRTTGSCTCPRSRRRRRASPTRCNRSACGRSGGAAYFEKRMNGMSALAAQARVGIGSEASRYQGGLVGKLWIEQAKMLFLGEADFIRPATSSAAASAQNQFVSYLGVTFFPIRGLMLGPGLRALPGEPVRRRDGPQRRRPGGQLLPLGPLRGRAASAAT